MLVFLPACPGMVEENMTRIYILKFIFFQDFGEEAQSCDEMLAFSWFGETPVVEGMERQVAREVRINYMMWRKEYNSNIPDFDELTGTEHFEVVTVLGLEPLLHSGRSESAQVKSVPVTH